MAMNDPVKPDSGNIPPDYKKPVEIKHAPGQAVQDSEKTLSPADDTLLSHIANGVKEIIPQKQPAAQEKKKIADDKQKNDVKTPQSQNPPDAEKNKQATNIGGAASPVQKEKASVPEKSPAPRKSKAEKTVIISLSELHPFNTFRKHPYEVRDDADMRDLSKSISEHGVQHPATVRPRENGGYEIISGHRRHRGSELAGIKDMPCIVREMSDYEAVQFMKESNKQRNVTLKSELARLLDLEVEAIKHRGARDKVGEAAGKTSYEMVGQNSDSCFNLTYNSITDGFLDCFTSQAMVYLI